MAQLGPNLAFSICPLDCLHITTSQFFLCLTSYTYLLYLLICFELTEVWGFIIIILNRILSLKLFFLKVNLKLLNLCCNICTDIYDS